MTDWDRSNVPNSPKAMVQELFQWAREVSDYLEVVQPEVEQALIGGGVAGDHTVTGIAVGDTLVSVIHNTAGVLADLTDEFTITGVDTINNTGGTDTSTDQLLVTWQSPSASSVPTKPSH